MRQFEELREAYCLVGHSHGGSVIADAVFRLSSRRTPASGLSRWITVGAPFIKLQKRRLLLSRLGLIGKTAYLAFLLLGTWLTIAFIYGIVTPDTARLASRNPTLQLHWDVGMVVSTVIRSLLACVVSFLPLLTIHVLLSLLEKRRLRMYSPKLRRRVSRTSLSHWLGLWHPADEAMRGLESVPHLSFPIFPRSFLVRPLSLAAVFLAPLLTVLLIYSYFGTPQMDSTEMFSSAPLLPQLPLFSVFIPIARLGIGAIAGLALVFFTLGGLLLICVGGVARLVSPLLSRSFDRITWAQLRQSAFGNDTLGEIAVGTAPRPNWGIDNPAPLPEDLTEELRAHANRAAAQSVLKLRDAVQVLAFTDANRRKSDLVAEYLTWDELIHTSYFKVPRFRKLLCYAIAHSPGFRSSEKFKSDPDYALVGTWYEQVQLKGALA